VAAFLVSLCGLALRELAPAIMRKIGEKIGERLGEEIRKKIFPKRKIEAPPEALETRQDIGVYGKIETRYPRLDGVANPWIISSLYNKAYRSHPIEVSTEFETSRKAGALIIKISGIQQAEIPPKIQVQAGILTIYVPYGSTVYLETGDDFDAGAQIQAQFMFSAPIKTVQDPYYRRGELVIQIQYCTPCQTVTPITIPPPKVIPPGVKRIELPAGRKVDAFIPIVYHKTA